MPNIFHTHAARVAAALLVVYMVWGTTYFALALALRDMPPLLMNASRFLLAGGLMLAWARWRGQAWPTRRQWGHAALVGALMVGGAMNLVGFAQKLGIGSGLMATVVTTMPMWLALWTHLGGERVHASSWLGLALGVAGAALLAQEGDFSVTWVGALCAFAAPLCWSLGSYASRRLNLPSPSMSSAAQWLVGGALSLLPGLWLESPQALGAATPAAWVAWAYLVGFGTVLTLSVYLWLLQNTSAALAGSYAFVNPAVALLVGTALGGEVLTGWVFAALPLIFLGLALILYGPRWVRGYTATHAAVADRPDAEVPGR